MDTFAYRLLEHLASVSPNTASGGLDSVTVALVMAALQALDYSGVSREDMDLPIISGNSADVLLADN